MNKITTANLSIDPELCKRIDRVVYSTSHDNLAFSKVIDRANLYRAELLALIASLNPNCAKIEATSSLYRLCCVADRLATDFGKHDSERGHANMQTAHNQLQNWK